MTLRQFLKAIGSSAALAVAILMGISILSPKGQASGDDNDRKDEASEIRKGFAIAPVPLNLEGKNRALVGLGSYIVNAQGDCNGCQWARPVFHSGQWNSNENSSAHRRWKAAVANIPSDSQQ